MTESWLSDKDLHAFDGQIDPAAVYEYEECGDEQAVALDEECGDEQAVALDEQRGDEQAVALDEQADPAEGFEPEPAGDDDPDLDCGGGDCDSDAGAPPLPPSAVVDTATEPAITHGDDAHQPSAGQAPPRFNKRIAAGFLGGTVAATVIAAGALLAMRSQPHTADPDHLAPPPALTPAAAAAPPTTASPAEATDPPIPYTATAVGCLPGSTAAQSAAGADPTQAWVCVTGGNIGQYVRVDLGRPMVITAACVTPGWVGTDASGADQWHQHGVLTRVQWSFNDSPPTVVPKDTNSVHGDACQPMPGHGVLASTVLMLVLGIGRAPADAAPTTPTPAVDDSPLGPILGPPAAPAPAPPSDPVVGVDQSHTDPADNSFAVSSIKLFGHPPQ